MDEANPTAPDLNEQYICVVLGCIIAARFAPDAALDGQGKTPTARTSVWL